MASSSSFRPLRPSSSSANPSETQPEDPASPSPVSSHAGVPQQDSLNAAKARKRRAPSHVSQNACTNCKRARAKCDGEDPEPCSRCIQRDIGDQCHYEVHVKTAKEEMVRRIKALEQQVGELQSSMRAKDNWIARALDSMEGNSMDPNHARVGRENRLDGQLTHLLGRPSGGSHYDASPGTEKAFSDIIQKCEQSMSFNHQPGSDDGPAFTWTKLVHPRVTTHLMGLYFTWIHPVHMLFSERHFMSSFESGNSEHCSKALVNVICAMGCFMLMDHGRDDTDARQLSEYFLHQFRADITMENQSRLTFATAYAILFLVELSANQARRAASHLRVAVDALQMVDRTIYPNDAFEIAAWGVYTLETMWSGFTYRKSTVYTSPHAIVFNGVDIESLNLPWSMYRTQEDISSGEPGHAARTAQQLAYLGRIVHDVVDMYCGSREIVTGDAVVQLYRRLTNWSEALPTDLDVERERPMPHLFHIQIYYHTAVCQLFQPLIDDPRLSEAIRRHLKSVIFKSTAHALKLLSTYRELYTNRQQPPLQAFCLMHICEARARVCGLSDKSTDGQETTSFCLDMLREALPAFPFIGPMQNMFCHQVADLQRVSGCCQILPSSPGAAAGNRMVYGLEDFLDACERSTYAQPRLVNERLDPNFGPHFEAAWTRFTESQGGGDHSLLRRQQSSTSDSSKAMDISALVNPS